MELRALQIQMQSALLEVMGARPVADAELGDEPVVGSEDESPVAATARGGVLSASIVDAPPLSPQARLDIYRRAYVLRLIDALADSYAMLKRALGDEDFEELGSRYVAAHPSVHRSIRWYGAELAQFLERTAPYREHPALAELALFEWTLAGVFDAPDAEPIGRAALKQVAPEDWAALRFEFHPSMRRLELAWNTVVAWRALSEDQAPPAPGLLDAPTPWLLWRREIKGELKNYFRSLDPLEAQALEMARNGASFAEVCAAMSPALADEEIPLRAATFIGTWADSGLLTALSIDG